MGLTNLTWKIAARVLSRPVVVAALKRYALKHPYIHIPGYMNRFWLLPYNKWLPVAVRLHHVLRPDLDDVLHDHPWNWRTVILQGAYYEEDVFGRITRHGQGATNYRTAESFHRIAAITEDVQLWTLFVTYRKRQKWGFMVGTPPRKIYHRNYQSPNGRDTV